jgi:hypothetical protein
LEGLAGIVATDIALETCACLVRLNFLPQPSIDHIEPSDVR